MRHFLVVFSLLVAFRLTALAELPVASPANAKPEASKLQSASSREVTDLPVRKVVLYKNGVGYFEHAGAVSGNQRVTIDFTSPQLNDVLQSLTVLDGGGGRIAGVNYNSTTPLAEQLKTLSLGMTDDPTSTELFQALRGQRVEVTGGPGAAAITGRLMSIESRTEKTGGSDSDATVEKFYLTLIAASGAVRVIELTPSLSVRPIDPSLQGQLDRYLELLSSAHSTGLRHLTLDALGQGQRELRVSYISEVPIWKSTYRIVFPRETTGNATVQGWAVVDNTVGADWNNVQLALVAGAPQSFIQPLSQPLYTRRPEIPIGTVAQTTPQTHEAAEQANQGSLSQLAAMAGPAPTPPQSMRFKGRNLGSANQTVAVDGFVTGPMPEAMAVGSGNGIGPGYSAGFGGNAGGAIYSVTTNAIQEGDVSTSAFDDFFEYALTQPVTIHKNESAMVPILQQDLPAEHVTLWSQQEAHPLRAVWLENKSKLTLDSGSFSIFENGEFAGEGLIEPIHPNEKRLLSYATDQAMRINVSARDSKRRMSHLKIHKDAVVETYMDVASVTYSAANSSDAERTVLIEHPRRTDGWSLDDGINAAETASNLYRFRVAVPAHSTEKLEVREHGPEFVYAKLSAGEDSTTYLLDLVKRVPDAQAQLQPVIDAEAQIADLDQRIAESKQQESAASTDEARDRENLTALKGNEAAKRFVDELNRAEDRLQTARKQSAELEQQKSVAVDKLNAQISALSFNWSAEASK